MGSDEKRQAADLETARPEEQKLTSIGIKRLEALTRTELADQFSGLTIADIETKLPDRQLLRFRKVCGQVVKRDPITGADRPVPFATVHVEDTDCGLLWYYPIGWPYGWLFPLFCHREELATVTTDACGRFCAYIPQFDIDWILRFRRRRICYPIIFLRPRLRDLLEKLPDPFEELPPKRPPIPEPDPPPILLGNGGLEFRRAGQLLGQRAAGVLAAHEASEGLGRTADAVHSLLDQPVPSMAAPLPSDVDEKTGRPKGLEGVLPQLTRLPDEQRELAEKSLARFDHHRFIGPFWRCRDVFVPEWTLIFDIPDVTFRVTQDVDGDGTEETIYSEGYFDVRWDAGAIPDVRLEASEIAIAGVSCDQPHVPCGDEPAIVLAGLSPLHNPAAPTDPYHDNGTGYARRPNRPHLSAEPSAAATDLATAPFTGTLQLYGCNHGLGGSFYRLLYTFEGTPPAVPFLNLTWHLVRLGPGGILQIRNVAPDGAGWYEVIDPAEGWMPANLLLNWPTGQDGLYEINMELGDASRSVVSTSATVGIRVDNSTPSAAFTGLDWRVGSAGAWQPLELVCPVVFRPAGQSIQFRVSYTSSAHHLRDVVLGAGGCGGAAPARLPAPGWSDPPTPAFVGGVSQSPYEHWHTEPADNAVARRAVFSLEPAPAAPQGAYSFNLDVRSRAFNPAGGDGGFEADWYYNIVYHNRPISLPVAVVDV